MQHESTYHKYYCNLSHIRTYDYDLKGFYTHKDEYNDRKNTEITLHDILDSTYKDYVIPEYTTLVDPEKLKGDFSPLQAQRFFSRYDLLIHQPNTNSGFSATLFGEKRKQKNTESKAIQYTSEYGYTLIIS